MRKIGSEQYMRKAGRMKKAAVFAVLGEVIGAAICWKFVFSEKDIGLK